jgi:hypothetical protein
MIPKIYDWLDANAPVLTAQPGSLVDLLDACLVDGYGSKTSAGWTREFAASVPANQRIYRAPQGLRPFLRIDDSGSTPTQGAYVATVNGYMNITGGFNGDYTGTFTEGWSAPNYIGKSIATVAADLPHQWLLAASGKAFVLFISKNPSVINSGMRPTLFGEYQAHHPDDVTACYLLANTSAANGVAETSPSLSIGTGGTSGSLQTPGQMFQSPSATYKDGLTYLTINNSNISGTPTVNDFVWSSRIVGVSSAIPRGYLTGVLNPLATINATQYPFWTDLGDKRIITTTSTSAYILDTGDWDALETS